RHGEDDERAQVAQSAVRQNLGVACGLLLQDAQGLSATIKLKEQMQRIAAGDIEDAVAIGYCDAAEQTGESTDAVPLRERSARAARLDSETDEELVAFDVVREVPARGEAERVGTAVVQLAAVDALVVGDKDRSAFIEYPVEGQRSLAPLSRRPESVEHAQYVERL
ncbi:MAG: hypothetical protein JWN10_41, partial [Solirubrobacterales bacterium]|nr:hypothetical protein [Solirubrobacterales bacterium]